MTSGPSFDERVQAILELLETRTRVTVQELSHRFAVSQVTVRSDLGYLAERGLVERIRGGARGARPGGQSEPAFDVRMRLLAAEKRAIGVAAAQLVQDGDAIALDCSTTAYYLALALTAKRDVVVVTNGLRVAAALAEAPGISVLVPGGTLRAAGMSLVGDWGRDDLRRLRIEHGFFGARGITHDGGLMDVNPEETRVKSALADACERVVGVFDHTKWDRSALLPFAPAERIAAIVTDGAAPAERVAEWRRRGVDVHIAPPVAAGAGAHVTDLRPRWAVGG
jgi:DeoR/GlpR family transcriptional regulator of sugar metabolism